LKQFHYKISSKINSKYEIISMLNIRKISFGNIIFFRKCISRFPSLLFRYLQRLLESFFIFLNLRDTTYKNKKYSDKSLRQKNEERKLDYRKRGIKWRLSKVPFTTKNNFQDFSTRPVRLTRTNKLIFSK
jgi:hypothetical protein